MKKIILIVIIMSVCILLAVNKILQQNYGLGYKIFKTPRMPYNFTLKYDPYKDYTINSCKTFIQIIGKNDLIKTNTQEIYVHKITAYGYNDNEFFVKAISKKNEENFIKISIDENRPKGNKIQYEIYKESDIVKNNLKNWYDLKDAKFYDNIFRMIHWILFFSFIILVFLFFRKTDRKI